MPENNPNNETPENAQVPREPEVDKGVIEGETVHEEQVENEIVNDEPVEPGSGGVIDEVKGILEELHISRKHIIGIVAFIVIIIVLISASFIFLLGYLDDGVDPVSQQDEEPVIEEPAPEDEGPGFFSQLWDRITGRDEEEPQPIEQPEQPKQKPEQPTQTDTVLDDVTQIGKDEALPSTTPVVDISQMDRQLAEFSTNVFIVMNELGVEEQLPSRLSYYVRTYRKMRNVFNTDLFLLLDNSNDRNVAFNFYLNELKASYAEAVLAFEALRQETAILTETLERLEESRSAAEERYLAASDSLTSEGLPELLEVYQRLAEQYIVVRSEVRARELIIIRYDEGLPVVADKIEAVEANKQAFVEGVRVIDFPRIDLDLVIEAE